MKQPKRWWLMLGAAAIFALSPAVAPSSPIEDERPASEEKEDANEEQGNPGPVAEEDEEIIKMLHFLEHLDMLMEVDTDMMQHLEVISEE
jgi:hypothetical protein